MQNIIPAVTVVVPIYNVEDYIVPCINSILNQTMQDFEVILIDDASPDNSYEICQKLYGENEKITIIRHEQNKGPGLSRNTGIAAARGKYIYFLDSDDVILPNALEILYRTAEETDADIVHSSLWYQVDNEDLKSNNLQNVKLYRDLDPKQGFSAEEVTERISKNWCMGGTPPMVWLNFYKKDFFIRNELRFPQMLGEDVVFSLMDAAFAKSYFKISQCFYVYRKRPNAITTTMSINHTSKMVKSYIIGTKYIEDNLKRLPAITLKEGFLEQLMHIYLSKCLTHFVDYYPYYNLQGNITKDLHSAINKEFKPFFEENSFFVEYLFHGFNSINLQFKHLLEENNKLKSALEQQSSFAEGGGTT